MKNITKNVFLHTLKFNVHNDKTGLACFFSKFTTAFVPGKKKIFSRRGWSEKILGSQSVYTLL